MKESTYVYANITYGYRKVYKKWAFKYSDTESLLVDCGGKEKADKVARIIGGSIKRSGKLDGLARSNISTVTR